MDPHELDFGSVRPPKNAGSGVVMLKGKLEYACDWTHFLLICFVIEQRPFWNGSGHFQIK